MRIKILPYCLIGLMAIATMPVTGPAAVFNLSGYTAVEGLFFTGSAALDDQDDDPQLSWVAVPELRAVSEDDAHQFKLVPFYRLDSVDDERTHFDLREAYWRYTFDSWEVLAGAGKVFWGVTESQHLVDIINQTDVLEDIDQEDKLGQPMVMLGSQRDWGEVQLFLMPYFRERRYPGQAGRLRAPLPVDDESRFESGAAEYHPDVALRYSHYFGDWDVGAYYFYGTSREPVLLPNEQGDRLIATYDLIHQAGLDVQYTRDAWLWKLEAILRDGHDDLFVAAVGGFEYTLYQVLQSSADLGLLMEYNWDGRDQNKAPVTIFDQDLFVGARLSLNDTQDTSALVGAIIDKGNGSTLLNIEFERRIAESIVIEAQARFFLNIAAGDPLQTVQKDDFINISLQYHF